MKIKIKRRRRRADNLREEENNRRRKAKQRNNIQNQNIRLSSGEVNKRPKWKSG